ncbi:MAG: hypothetical protein AAFO95_10330 [Cyanobacteria bacterium J06600_6]
MLGILNKLMLTTGIVMLTSGFTVNSWATEPIEIDTLCLKFPLNSRCQSYQPDSTLFKPNLVKYQLDRQTFCEEFSFNSRCLTDPVEIINFNLDEEEWIRIKKSGNKIQLFHSDRRVDSLVSLATGGAASLIPEPGILSLLPFSWLDLLPLDLNKYDWQDHQVTQVSFKSDRCQFDDCIVSGTTTIDLPANTKFSQGLFTVEYTEQELLRSVTFRIPADIEVTPIDTVTIQVPETARRSP